MMERPLLAFTIVAAMLLAGCTTSDPPGSTGAPVDLAQECQPKGANPHVVLQTSMGQIVLEVFREQVPLTAENFLGHVRSGVYAGTTFHRIITGFMMQGGDPNSKDSNPSNDGQGGAGDDIQDEFHWHLRHKGEGVVSMANAGPNTGSSQFFITFADTPHLDDRHAIFAKVVCGIDVVRKVDSDAASQDGKPRVTVTLESASVVEPSTPPTAMAELTMWVPDPNNRVPEAGGATAFLATVHNNGTQRATTTVEARGVPQGVTVTVEKPSIVVPADQRVAFVVKVDVAQGAPALARFNLTATSGQSLAQVQLSVQRDASVGPERVESGDTVVGNYVGMSVDGRIFDTSVEGIGKDAAARGAVYGFNAATKRYSTFEFTPGGNVIQGFTDIALGTAEGSSNAARIPPEKAYGPSGQHRLAGRTLLFQLDIVDIK